MTTSRRRLLIALLLPVLALRVLLPAGFMPLAEAGELRVVMCSDGMLLPGTDSRGDHPDADQMGKCPFASASFNVPPPHFVAVAATATLTAQFLSFPAEDLPRSTGPPRAAAARAPPYHS